MQTYSDNHHVHKHVPITATDIYTNIYRRVQEQACSNQLELVGKSVLLVTDSALLAPGVYSTHTLSHPHTHSQDEIKAIWTALCCLFNILCLFSDYFCLCLSYLFLSFVCLFPFFQQYLFWKPAPRHLNCPCNFEMKMNQQYIQCLVDKILPQSLLFVS